MIYYFSGTGNSEWAAKTLAEKIGDPALKVTDVLKAQAGEKIHVAANERLVLVFPVYAWNLPKPVSELVKLIDADADAYICAVCTCGDEAGCLAQVLKKRIPLKYASSLVMPNNYIVLDDVDSEETALEKVKAAAVRLNEIAQEISNGQNVFEVKQGSFPIIKTLVASHFFNKYALDAKPFFTQTSCTACGLCEKNCPMENITIVDEMPFWGNECVQCLACIHRCPTRAIQYGRSTKKRGRYYFNYGDEIYS